MYIADYYRRFLSLEATLITSYGPDFLPYAIETNIVPAKPNQPGTLLYRNIIATGHRQWFCESAEYAGPPEINETAVEALTQADIFILATILPNYPASYVQRLMRYLPDTCVTALCVQGYLRTVTDSSEVIPRDFDEAAAILPLFDITVLSDEDHPLAMKMAHDWKALPGAKQIIVSQGAHGASILTSDNVQPVPTTAVNEADIIDSVGCGDVFLGSLVYEYYTKPDIYRAVTKAHVAARNKLLAVNSGVSLT